LFHRNFDCLGIKAVELKGRLRPAFSLVGGATPLVNWRAILAAPNIPIRRRRARVMA